MSAKLSKQAKIGDKFGDLTVLAEIAPYIAPTKKTVRKFSCICSCSKIIEIRMPRLFRDRTNKCRHGKNSKRKPRTVITKDLIGTSKYRLTIVDKRIVRSCFRWVAKCTCGNEVLLKNYKAMYLTLSEDHPEAKKSCGCLEKENVLRAQSGNRKKAEGISNFDLRAKRLWGKTLYKEISLEDFKEISQKRCTYCGLESSKSNDYHGFTYNGLDRIDNNQDHNKNNVVPACKFCNVARRDRTQIEFINWAMSVDLNKSKKSQKSFLLKSVSLVKRKYITLAAKAIYKKNYTDGISFENFFILSQQNCYYCGIKPSNNLHLVNSNNINKIFVYNGLDRQDNSKDHSLSNVVTCCAWCNKSKSDKKIDEFFVWMKRIQDFQNKMKIISLFSKTSNNIRYKYNVCVHT